MLVTEKLCKVPFDAVTKSATLSLFKKLVQWMSIVTININFCKQIKLGTMCNCKFFYFSIGSRFLASKLITRKAKDSKTKLMIPESDIR